MHCSLRALPFLFLCGTPLIACTGDYLAAGPPKPACSATPEKCPLGERCVEGLDCASNSCAGQICRAPSCTNGKQDGAERGTDCGGDCGACDGATCQVASDCVSSRCHAQVCVPQGTKLCGVGVAALCALDAECTQDLDCVSDYCADIRCSAPTEASAHDGRRNGNETGVDCGGPLAPAAACAEGEGCKVDLDCEAFCVAGKCNAPTPSDGKKNRGETDIDCGGPNAPKCEPNKVCAVGTDCNGRQCSNGICVAPTADDGVKNGTETDVDCGGGRLQEGAVDYTPPSCAAGKVCAADRDCMGAVCNYAKTCADRPSCRNHFGGDTCGKGEIDEAGHVHESCCRTLPLPGQPGAFLGKYEVTSGRMHEFIAAVDGDVRTWVQGHRNPQLPASIDGYLPAAYLGDYGVYDHLTNGATGHWANNRGCFTSSDVSVQGHSTYWLSAAEYGVWGPATERAYTKDQLDVKSLNCVSSYMALAFCDWDGGRLPTPEEYAAAWGGAKYPWGAGPAPTNDKSYWPANNIYTNTNFDHKYVFPTLFENGIEVTSGWDIAYRIAAPGRFFNDRRPAGDVPESWMDLAANLMEFSYTGGATYRLVGGSWEGHGVELNNGDYPVNFKYGKTGFRCVYPTATK